MCVLRYRGAGGSAYERTQPDERTQPENNVKRTVKRTKANAITESTQNDEYSRNTFRYRLGRRSKRPSSSCIVVRGGCFGSTHSTLVIANIVRRPTADEGHNNSHSPQIFTHSFVSRQMYRDMVKADGTLCDVGECIYHRATHYPPETRSLTHSPSSACSRVRFLYPLRTSCVLALHLVDGLSGSPVGM